MPLCNVANKNIFLNNWQKSKTNLDHLTLKNDFNPLQLKRLWAQTKTFEAFKVLRFRIQWFILTFNRQTAELTFLTENNLFCFLLVF